VEQGFALSPVLSVYLAFIFHILEKCLKNLKFLISILSFVDNGLFIAQSKSLTILNSFLFCSYNIASSLLKKFGFIIEHEKTEMFSFSRSHGVFDSPSLDFSSLGGLILCSKDIWVLSLIESFHFINISISTLTKLF